MIHFYTWYHCSILQTRWYHPHLWQMHFTPTYCFWVWLKGKYRADSNPCSNQLKQELSLSLWMCPHSVCSSHLLLLTFRFESCRNYFLKFFFVSIALDLQSIFAENNCSFCANWCSIGSENIMYHNYSWCMFTMLNERHQMNHLSTKWESMSKAVL